MSAWVAEIREDAVTEEALAWLDDHDPSQRFLLNVHYLDPLDNDSDKFKDAVIVRVANDGIGISFVEMAEF